MAGGVLAPKVCPQPVQHQMSRGIRPCLGEIGAEPSREP
jgi:hypothetical protein